MVLTWAWLGMDCGRQRRPFWLSLLAGHWGCSSACCAGHGSSGWWTTPPEHPHRPLRPVYLRRGARGDDAGHPLCIVDGTYMGSLLVVWGGIASAVLLILIFTVSYWVGRRIVKAP